MTGIRLSALRARRQAFGQALAAAMPLLRMEALSLACSAGEADDLVDDVVLEALVSAPDRPAEVPDRAHLVTLLRNARFTRTSVAERGDAGWPVAWLGSPAPTGPRALAARIARLPAEERRALVLVALLGLGPEQAAEVADCLVAEVNDRLQRALDRLGLRRGAGEDGPDLPSAWTAWATAVP